MAGVKYWYDGKIIGVEQGLGESWIVVWHSPAGKHRVKTKALPACTAEASCQENLDAWARRKGLEAAG